MLLLGFDVETTGLDPKIHSICEVGAVLWDTDYRRTVQSMGYLVKVSPDAPFEEDAITTSGLTAELLAKYGKDSERSLKQLLNLYDQADYIVAHNGNTCDRPFLRAWMTAHGLLESFPEEKFWLDTMTDIEYPKKWNRQLTSLAAYHGFLNPFPHQALADAMTCLRILDFYPLDKVIEYAKIPVIGIRLTIPFESKEWAKDRSYFSYYRDGKFRFWMKKIKENKFDEEAEEAKSVGFSITKIEIPEGVY